MSQSAEPLTIVVVRTGGFAGLRRTWRVAADEASAPVWRDLVDACPWGAAGMVEASEGADRYVWEVTAAEGAARHPVADAGVARHVVLGERAAAGPWRELIDAVRERGEPTPPDPVSG